MYFYFVIIYVVTGSVLKRRSPANDAEIEKITSHKNQKTTSVSLQIGSRFDLYELIRRLSKIIKSGPKLSEEKNWLQNIEELLLYKTLKLI